MLESISSTGVPIPPEVCIGLGVIILILGLWKYRYGKATLNWPTVKGKVTVSYVEKKVHVGQGRSKTTRTHYLEYEYEVNETAYRGSRKRFGLINFEGASISFQKYHLNREVNVRYKPSKPSVCCLEPGVDWTNYVVMALGGALLLFGLVIL